MRIYIKIFKGVENLRFKNSQSHNSRKKSFTNAESLDSMDIEDEGFIEGDVNIGRSIATFSFGGDVNANMDDGSIKNQSLLKPDSINQSKEQRSKSSLRGITPPVDGEQYTVKRCYQYRPSTVRKLNELKAKHPDVTAYLNTIIDEAIVYYYNHIFNDGGNSQKSST
jgi:hypothetical protein